MRIFAPTHHPFGIAHSPGPGRHSSALSHIQARMALTDRPRPGWNSRPGTGPVQRARGHGPRAPHTRHSPCSPAHSPCSAPRPHAPTSRLDHGTPGRGEAAATLTPHTWTPHGHRADEPSEGLRSGLDGSLRADPEGPGSRTRGPDWLGPARLGPARPPPRQARPTTHHPTPLFRHADHDQRARSTAPSGKLALRSIPPADTLPAYALPTAWPGPAIPWFVACSAYGNRARAPDGLGSEHAPMRCSKHTYLALVQREGLRASQDVITSSGMVRGGPRPSNQVPGPRVTTREGTSAGAARP